MTASQYTAKFTRITIRPILGGFFGYWWIATDSITAKRMSGWALSDRRAQGYAWRAISARRYFNGGS